MGEFTFQETKAHQQLSLKRLRIVHTLKPLNVKRTSSAKSGFLVSIDNSSRSSTAIWRGMVCDAKALNPPVSPNDETTNMGAAKNIASLLLLYGLQPRMFIVGKPVGV